MPGFGYDTLLPYFYLSAHIMETKLEILERNQQFEEITHFLSLFYAIEDFYCDVVRGNMHVW